MMNKIENKKQLILTSLTFILILAIGLAGYLYINRETKEKLGKLRKTKPSPSPAIMLSKKEPVSSPRQTIILPNQPKAEQKSILYLTTNNNQESFKLGETFNLNIVVQSAGEIVDGVEFVLNYDSSKVEIGEPIPGPFFSLYPQKQVNSQKGTVRIIALQGPNESKSLNQAVVITLPIKTLQKGKTSFTFNKDKAHIAAYGGQELLENTTDLTVKIN